MSDMDEINRHKFGSLEWIEHDIARCAKHGWLGTNEGELQPEIIDALKSKGYKVERIIHNEDDSKRYCCDNCYRTNIMYVSWRRPTAPYFYVAQLGYCNGYHSEINRILEQIDTADKIALQKNSTIVPGLYGDRYWMSDETMNFLVKLGCTCDYIDDVNSDDYRSYQISWRESRQWIGAHDSIHEEICRLIGMMDQTVKAGQSKLTYDVKHAETIAFLTEADVHYADGLLTWVNH